MKTETERLAAYRQLRTEIRGSDKYLIVGVDVAKDTHHAFIGTPTGKMLSKQLRFANNREGFELLTSRVETLRLQQHLEQVVYGLEPTANYHKPLAEYLVRHDLSVVQVAGTAVKQNRELLDGRWDKHDRKDAANVADLIAQGKCQFYDYPELKVRELRELLSIKYKLKKQEHGLKTRIRNNLLAKYFPEMDQFMNTCKQDTYTIIGSCCVPEQIASLDFEQFFEQIVRVRRGQRQTDHLYQIWQSAKDSIGCQTDETCGFEGHLLIEQLQQTCQHIHELEQRIEQLCLTFDEYPYLLSIPGIGPDISSRILAYIGDPYRFDNAHQVIKLAGLDLNASRSGRPALKATPVISKRGQADLRYGLVQAACVASTSNAYFSQWFAKKLNGRERENGIGMILRVKLAAKMLIIAWTMMKNKEMFAYERLINC
jgi:transposase